MKVQGTGGTGGKWGDDGMGMGRGPQERRWVGETGRVARKRDSKRRKLFETLGGRRFGGKSGEGVRWRATNGPLPKQDRGAVTTQLKGRDARVHLHSSNGSVASSPFNQTKGDIL